MLERYCFYLHITSVPWISRRSYIASRISKYNTKWSLKIKML